MPTFITPQLNQRRGPVPLPRDVAMVSLNAAILSALAAGPMTTRELWRELPVAVDWNRLRHLDRLVGRGAVRAEGGRFSCGEKALIAKTGVGNSSRKVAAGGGK